MVYPLEAGGKRIRPVLVILACQAVGGEVKDCLDAALAVELLHTFTLVHDDIMDHDSIRRGRPTVHAKWDESTAILAGDGLVTMAYRVLLRTEHPELISVLQRFTDGLLALCEGQALDKAFEIRDGVSVEEYNGMIEKKTSKLFEVACEIGAILGDGNVEEREALRRFATCFGKAFQIQDDLLDILSEEEISGKPLGSDLIEKKKTYLTIHFLDSASSSKKARFRRLWGKNPIAREDILEIKALFKGVGTFQEARKDVEELLYEALRSLDPLPPGETKEDLRTLAVKIQERVY